MRTTKKDVKRRVASLHLILLLFLGNGNLISGGTTLAPICIKIISSTILLRLKGSIILVATERYYHEPVRTPPSKSNATASAEYRLWSLNGAVLGWSRIGPTEDHGRPKAAL